ncbi:hypothetical protein WMY93_017973 [Mugilogobius chulae]|uniref:Gonadotropin subunit beta-2 n=1 Tax=Mugilogobius chulae TaxID=88201 RepID=A0AAW0NLS9_9GOBI
MPSLSSTLLLLSCLCVCSVSPAEGFHLPRCQLVNQTVSLEKEGCPRCHSVETTICSGHCPTKDPVMKIPFNHVYQDVCTYRDYVYRKLELPDCPRRSGPGGALPGGPELSLAGAAPWTSPTVTFESLQPDFCMNDIPFSLLTLTLSAQLTQE